LRGHLRMTEIGPASVRLAYGRTPVRRASAGELAPQARNPPADHAARQNGRLRRFAPNPPYEFCRPREACPRESGERRPMITALSRGLWLWVPALPRLKAGVGRDDGKLWCKPTGNLMQISE
jgi:hypothetical protein